MKEDKVFDRGSEEYGDARDMEDYEEMNKPEPEHVVLVNFTDEDGTVYWAGSVYPQEGCNPSAERIAYLQSDETAFGRPVIM